MGNRIYRTRSTVDDRFTRPQRLAPDSWNVDYKKLRKLILSEKLAPCFDGVEDSNLDLEECPICFLYFPSLNRSKCCTKGICTECYLQVEHLNATPSAPCPFCKTSSYFVEYLGARTQEEKVQEQAEEQKVIEAKIRMQQRESQDANQIILANQNSSPVEGPSPMSGSRELPNGGVQDLGDSELSLAGGDIELAESSLNAWNERNEEFDQNLEEIMMTEAIWQSMQIMVHLRVDHISNTWDLSHKQASLLSQDQQSSGSTGTGGETQRSNQSEPSLADSITGGIAVAIARLVERNALRSEISPSIHGIETIQTQNVTSIEGRQSYTQSPTSYNADIPEVGSIRSDLDPEFDDVHSEDGCMENSCSTTEDDSWELHSAHSLNGSQCSSDESIYDEDLAAKEAIDVDSSCLSSVHTISDSSFGSPNRSYVGGSPIYSQLSGPNTIERQLRAFANYL